MKTFFPFCLFTILLLLGFIAQDMLPAMTFLGQTSLLLVPIIFCFATLALSFSSALLFALITAIISGLMVMQFSSNHAEIGLGWFICFFMIWVIILQFLSDLTQGVRWEVHAIGSALCTATLLFGEFLILSLKRGDFVITERTFIVIIIPTLISLLLAPLLYGFLQFFLLPAIPVVAKK